MKVWASLVVLISLISQSLQAESMTIRFEDLHDLILTKHQGVKVGEEQIKAVERRIRAVDSSFLPRASLDLGTAHQKEANGMGETAAFWKLDLESNLYRGGRDEVAKAMDENQVEIKKLDAQAFLRTQTYLARSSYIELLFQKKRIALQMSLRNDYESLKKSIQVKINSGLLTESILQLMTIERDEIDRQLIVLNSESKSMQEELCLLLGIDHHSEFNLASDFNLPKIEVDPNEDSTIVEETLPEIQKFALLGKRYGLETQIRNEWWRPDLSVFASYANFAIEDRFEPGPLPEREMKVGLRLSFDLESRQNLDRERFAKESERKALQYQKNLLSEEMRHKAEEFKRDMNTRLSVLKAYEQSLAKSEKLKKRLFNEFDRGLVNGNDVFSSIRSIQLMKQRQIDEELRYFLSKNSYDSITNAQIY
jgi:outer membrane protein TolC